jgi:hypothetical protein
VTTAHEGSNCGQGWRGNVAGERSRRRPAADAAGVAIPASSRSGSVNRQRGGLQCALGGAPRCLGSGKK